MLVLGVVLSEGHNKHNGTIYAYRVRQLASLPEIFFVFVQRSTLPSFLTMGGHGHLSVSMMLTFPDNHPVEVRQPTAFGCFSRLCVFKVFPHFLVTW